MMHFSAKERWQGVAWAKRLERSLCEQFWLPVAILVLQPLSAGCLAFASSNHSFGWLAWVCLLPLFLVTVFFRPSVAGVYGFFWGLSYFAALSIFVKSAPWPTSFWYGALTTIAPGIYTSVVGWVVRRSGFNPLFVGFAWIGLELLLRPLSLPLGLLGTTHATGEWGDLAGPLLGYAIISFVIAFVNAILLRFLLGLRVPRPQTIKPKSGGRRLLISLRAQVLQPVIANSRKACRAPPVNEFHHS